MESFIESMRLLWSGEDLVEFIRNITRTADIVIVTSSIDIMFLFGLLGAFLCLALYMIKCQYDSYEEAVENASANLRNHNPHIRLGHRYRQQLRNRSPWTITTIVEEEEAQMGESDGEREANINILAEADDGYRGTVTLSGGMAGDYDTRLVTRSRFRFIVGAVLCVYQVATFWMWKVFGKKAADEKKPMVQSETSEELIQHKSESDIQISITGDSEETSSSLSYEPGEIEVTPIVLSDIHESDDEPNFDTTPDGDADLEAEKMIKTPGTPAKPIRVCASKKFDFSTSESSLVTKADCVVSPKKAVAPTSRPTAQAKLAPASPIRSKSNMAATKKSPSYLKISLKAKDLPPSKLKRQPKPAATASLSNTECTAPLAKIPEEPEVLDDETGPEFLDYADLKEQVELLKMLREGERAAAATDGTH